MPLGNEDGEVLSGCVGSCQPQETTSVLKIQLREGDKDFPVLLSGEAHVSLRPDKS